jgi:aryl-alcohol dehydrogenase-like predicted oxidoreductase
MEERALGNSGLFVSSVTLGTMTWGRDTDVYEARDQFNIYYNAGGRSLDTADVYCDGTSEEIVGEFLREFPDVILATKAVAVPEPRKRDASRRHLLNALDNSLRRLRRNHVDIWYVHAWDPLTPLEETLSVCQSVIASGKVRYIGISNYSGWQLATLATMAQNSIPLVAAQMEYSLLERGIEREVVQASNAHGIGVTAWSPLGRGVLTGKYRNSTPADSRGASQHFANFVAPYLTDNSRRIVEALAVASDGLGRPMLDTALAWVLAQPQVATAIVGARTAAQVRAIMAADISVLPEGIHSALSDVSAPAKSYPEFGWNQS